MRVLCERGAGTPEARATRQASTSLSAGIGWQIPRIPGLGEVDWRVVFAALYRAGYPGDCIIEHEDRDFEGTDELVKRGFIIARETLRPFVV